MRAYGLPIRSHFAQPHTFMDLLLFLTHSFCVAIHFIKNFFEINESATAKHQQQLVGQSTNIIGFCLLWRQPIYVIKNLMRIGSFSICNRFISINKLIKICPKTACSHLVSLSGSPKLVSSIYYMFCVLCGRWKYLT